MREITRPGRYQAPGLEDWSVARNDNGCIQFRARLVGTSFKPEGVGRYEDLEEPESITAFINLTRKDGSPITQQVEALQKALGWSGKSLRELQEADHSQTAVSFVVSRDEYEGKVGLSVDWINAPAGFKKATGDELAELDGAWQPIGGAVVNTDDIPF